MILIIPLSFCMVIFILLCALFAEIIGTIAGFWSSSILLPLLSQMMDFQNVLLLVAIYHIFWNGSRLFYFYKHIHTKIVLLFWIPSILLTIVGAHYSSQIDQQILKFSLGCVLFIFALYSLFRPSWRIQPSKFFGIIGWGLSGFTAGLIGTGWVLRWAFLTSFGLQKEVYIGTIALIALIVDVTRIPLYLSYGYLDTQFLLLIPPLFLVALLGSYIGKQIIQIIPSNTLRSIILVGIVILSCMMIWQNW